MAARINALELLVYRYFTPHMENKNLRYTAYALGALAVGGASLKIGTSPLQLTVIPATLFVIYQKNKDLLSADSAEKASRLAYQLFVAMGIWGVLLSGTTVALVFHSGNLIVQGVPSFNILAILKALNSLSSIGWLWGPLAFYLLTKSDSVLFQNAENQLRAAIERLLRELKQDIQSYRERNPPLVLLNSLFASNYKTYLPAPFIPPLRALEVQTASILERIFPLLAALQEMARQQEEADGNALAAMAERVEQLQQSAGTLMEDARALPPIIFAIFREFTTYLRAPAPPPAANPDRNKDLANKAFHYSFTAILALLPLYLNPIPTIAGFGLGLFYPMGLQTEEMLKRWTLVPDFCEKSTTQKCWFIWKETFTTLGNISNIPLISYPMALKHGFFWAETFRHYAALIVPPAA